MVHVSCQGSLNAMSASCHGRQSLELPCATCLELGLLENVLALAQG